MGSSSSDSAVRSTTAFAGLGLGRRVRVVVGRGVGWLGGARRGLGRFVRRCAVRCNGFVGSGCLCCCFVRCTSVAPGTMRAGLCALAVARRCTLRGRDGLPIASDGTVRRLDPGPARPMLLFSRAKRAPVCVRTPARRQASYGVDGAACCTSPPSPCMQALTTRVAPYVRGPPLGNNRCADADAVPDCRRCFMLRMLASATRRCGVTSPPAARGGVVTEPADISSRWRENELPAAAEVGGTPKLMVVRTWAAKRCRKARCLVCQHRGQPGWRLGFPNTVTSSTQRRTTDRPSCTQTVHWRAKRGRSTSCNRGPDHGQSGRHEMLQDALARLPNLITQP